MDNLLYSHAELRAALRIAGQRIRQLQFGRKDDPVLVKLRQVLREGRVVAKRYEDGQKTFVAIS